MPAKTKAKAKKKRIRKRKEPTWPATQVEMRSVDSLVPYARNARTHSPKQVDQVVASIKEWGWTVPCLIDKDGGMIAGHCRLLAAKKLGITEVPVMVAVGWSEAQKRAYVLADNKLAENAGWDTDLLKLDLGELSALDFDLSLTGFDVQEITQLTSDHEDADHAPEVQIEAVSKTGDLWLLERHRLACGDSTSSGVLRRLGNRPDLVATDPPYGIGIVPASGKIGGDVLAKNRVYRKICGDDESFDPSFLFGIADHTLVWGANYFPNRLPSSGQWIVWDKGRPEGVTFSDCELAWTSRGGTSVKKLSCVWNGMIREGESGPRHHPTQKPLKIIRESIELFEGISTVLDPFVGSGSTILACEQLGKLSRCVEIDPLYVDVCVRRWQDFTGIDATLKSTGQTFEEVRAERLSSAS